MHVKVSDTKNPDKGTFDMDPNLQKSPKLTEIRTLVQYQVQFEVGQGICLPGNSKYRIRLQMGKFVIDSNQPQDYNN